MDRHTDVYTCMSEELKCKGRRKVEAVRQAGASSVQVQGPVLALSGPRDRQVQKARGLECAQHRGVGDPSVQGDWSQSSMAASLAEAGAEGGQT